MYTGVMETTLNHLKPKPETVSPMEIMYVVEAERKYLARLLHDTTAQDLSNLSLAIEIALRTMDSGGDVKAALHRVREAAITVNAALRMARRT